MQHALLDRIEYRESDTPALPRGGVRLTCYNIERGLRLDAILELWRRHPVGSSDVILLSEADRGMARTDNRHVTQEFAEVLGFSWAYAVEFLELTKGNRRERRTAGENQTGHIGNAILSRYPLSNLQLVRLPSFFDPSQRYMARIGTRMALLADVTHEQPFTVASVHLEAHSSPQERSQQMEALLAAIGDRDRGQPIVLGGDMNTMGLNVRRLYRSMLRRPWLVAGTPSTRLLEKIEPLFALLARAGFAYRHCNLEEHTFRDYGYRAHLDWFFVKNVEPRRLRNPVVHRAFDDSRRFSDHQPISVELALDDADC